jgi:uncharacterized Fe-S radical SAM superfamily protein PflX
MIKMIKKFNVVGLVLDDCPRIKSRTLPARVEVSEYCAVCPRQCGIDYEKMEVACGRPAVPSLASFDASLVDAPGANEVASGVVNV